MVSGFTIDKRYNAQLLNCLRRLRDDAEEEGFTESSEELLTMAAQFLHFNADDDGLTQVVRDAIEITKDLILEKDMVFLFHTPNTDPMKLERRDAALVMTMSAAVNYAVDDWLSKYSHDPDLADKDGAYSIMDLDNLAAMLDRHVHRQMVHYNILD